MRLCLVHFQMNAGRKRKLLAIDLVIPRRAECEALRYLGCCRKVPYLIDWSLAT